MFIGTESHLNLGMSLAVFVTVYF